MIRRAMPHHRLLAVWTLLVVSTVACGGGREVGPRSSSAEAVTSTSPDGRLTVNSRLRLDGIGPIKVGMTPGEASRASGRRIELGPDSGGPDPSSCGFAEPDGGPDVAFMVVEGRIRRVDVRPPSAVATVSGVRIGATEAEVERVYRGRLQVQAHPYDEGGHYLIYEPPEPGQRGLLLIFETDGATVTSFRAGERSAVEAIEGCA